MKSVHAILAAVCAFSFGAFAQSPVTLTVDNQAIGRTVPPDFVGVSIFTQTQARDHKGVAGNLFSGTMLAFFSFLGLNKTL